MNHTIGHICLQFMVTVFTPCGQKGKYILKPKQILIDNYFKEFQWELWVIC